MYFKNLYFFFKAFCLLDGGLFTLTKKGRNKGRSTKDNKEGALTIHTHCWIARGRLSPWLQLPLAARAAGAKKASQTCQRHRHYFQHRVSPSLVFIFALSHFPRQSSGNSPKSLQRRVYHRPANDKTGNDNSPASRAPTLAGLMAFFERCQLQQSGSWFVRTRPEMNCRRALLLFLLICESMCRELLFGGSDAGESEMTWRAFSSCKKPFCEIWHALTWHFFTLFSCYFHHSPLDR